MNKDPITPEVGAWAHTKLDRLERYLKAYMTVFSKPQRYAHYHCAYIDAFAGTGDHRVRSDPPDEATGHLFDEPKEDTPSKAAFNDGSPRRALGIEPPFHSYVFVEQDPTRVTQLQRLHQDFPNRRIRIYQDDCNAYLHQLARSPKANWSRHRAVVFLDPYGMQVQWATVEALAKTQAIEVIINFPVWMAVQRMLPRDGAPPESWMQRLDETFGTRGWYDVMYAESPRAQQGLFTEDAAIDHDIHKVGNSSDLIDLYRRRLGEVFGHVTRAAVVRSSRNHPLYCLIHAGPNETGHRIANHVLRMGEWM